MGGWVGGCGGVCRGEGGGGARLQQVVTGLRGTSTARVRG